MATTRITVTIDEKVLRALKASAHRAGVSIDDRVEAALRRDLGLELFDRVGARNDIDEAQAVELAVEAQHATRPHRR